MADLHETDDSLPGDEPEPGEIRRVLALAAQATPGRDLAGSDRHFAHAVERQQRVARALQSGGPRTPPTLESAIDSMHADRRRARASRFRLVLARPLGLGAALAAAGAAVVVVVALITAGGSRELSASSVAAVWKLPATGRRAAPNPDNPAVLDVSFHGTAFPNYRDREGWHPSGTRAGRIDGRPALTVYYVTGNRRAAYTVVAGSRISVPSGARRFTAGGVHLIEYRDGDRWIIVFKERGNSCVLTAAAPREKRWLVKLAAWDSTRSTVSA